MTAASASRHVQALALPASETALVERWFAERDLVVMQGREKQADGRDLATILDGLAAGAAARLHPGVSGDGRPKLLGR